MKIAKKILLIFLICIFISSCDNPSNKELSQGAQKLITQAFTDIDPNFMFQMNMYFQ